MHCNPRPAGRILSTLRNSNYYGLNLPKFLGRPNSQYDCLWSQGLWGGGAGCRRSCGWVSNPAGLVPSKRRGSTQRSGHAVPQGGHVSTQRKGRRLQARERACTGSPSAGSCSYCPASREEEIRVHCSRRPVRSTLLWQPECINTAVLHLNSKLSSSWEKHSVKRNKRQKICL